MEAEQLDPINKLKPALPEIANVLRLRENRNRFGNISDEIWRRVTDEELSLIAEGIRGHLDIPFDFNLTENGLVAADGEEFSVIAKNGLNHIRQKAVQDSRYQFLVDRATHEYNEIKTVHRLLDGSIAAKTLITISPYPEEAARAFGNAFVQNQGFHPDRRLAIVRAIERTPEGIRMRTRGVEGSELAKWNQILPSTHYSESTDDLLARPLFTNDSAIDALDAMQNKYETISGNGWNKAGSLDVWSFLHSQTELIDFYFANLKGLSDGNLGGRELLVLTNNLRRQFWAAIYKRHESQKNGKDYMSGNNAGEVFTAAVIELDSRHEVFTTCGMSIETSTPQTLQGLMSEVFGHDKILRCVHCPYCKRVVDAEQNKYKNTIECLNKQCRAKVNSKNGKIIRKSKINKTAEDFWFTFLQMFWGIG